MALQTDLVTYLRTQHFLQHGSLEGAPAYQKLPSRGYVVTPPVEKHYLQPPLRFYFRKSKTSRSNWRRTWKTQLDLRQLFTVGKIMAIERKKAEKERKEAERMANEDERSRRVAYYREHEHEQYFMYM